jgi:hypothetical protein
MTTFFHVENDLNDSWLEFAKGNDDVKLKIIVFFHIKCNYACTPSYHMGYFVI